MRKRVIYGYGMENGSVTVNASQRDVIQRIFYDYTSGSSICQIVQALNAGDAPSADGKTWTHGAVGRLLKDRRYLGDAVYTAIISEEIFLQAQARRQEVSEKTGKGWAERERLFCEGMVFCGECGRKYWRLHYPKRVVWTCGLHLQGDRDKNGNVCSNKRRLTDKEIEKSFILLQNRIYDGSLTIRQLQKRSTKRLEMLKAKYGEMLADADNYEEKSLADIIFWIAAEEYAQSSGVEGRIIMQTVQKAGRTAEFQAEVFRKVVRKIIVTETGLCFELINGQKIQST